MMQRGFVCASDGRIIWSWRWAEPGPSRQGLPLEAPGGCLVELPEEADDTIAYEIHQTVGGGWTRADLESAFGSVTVVEIPADLPPPPPAGRQHHVLVGSRAIVEVDAPRPARPVRTKEEVLGRSGRRGGADGAVILVALLPGGSYPPPAPGGAPEMKPADPETDDHALHSPPRD